MSLRKRVLIAIAACLYYSGLVAIARWWTRRTPARLAILNYHQASGGNLRQHLAYLRRYYRILPIEAALAELYRLSRDVPQRADTRTPLVLSFDDGYRDNYTEGLALAREFEVPLTIYLVPGYIDSGDYFWWGEGKRLVQRAQVQEVEIEGTTYHLQQADERQALSRLIDMRVRYAHAVAEREAFLAMVRTALDVPSVVLPEEQAAMPLTWEQVREMEQSGWICFGAHTMHHPILSYLTDAAELQRELSECRVRLEEQLGHAVRSFAYPIGQMQHIGPETYKAVRRAGYDWAVTTRYGINTPQTNPLSLYRIEADVDQHWLVVAASTAGLWGPISRLRWLPEIRKRFTNSK
jgi:peptidoglycan/xylan/chitin deacetylase (PgdA/CDA1 family)